MNAKLISIAGPLKGTTFELTEDEVFIGRDPSNGVSINDRSVSRQHCLIKREEGVYKVRDLGSHNGTFINGVPAGEQTVKHGDRIQISDSFFLFLLHDEEENPSSADDVRFDDGALLTMSMVRFRPEDAPHLIAHELNALLKISAKINVTRSLKALQHELLESIFEIVPAERGAVLLVDESLENLSSAYVLERTPNPHQPMQVSRTVAEQVLGEGVAILSNDIVESATLSKAQSLMACRIQSLLCVPLTLLNKVTGIIYLDICQSRDSFNERHLQMTTAIAGFTSGALENARHVEWLESENRRLQADIRAEHNMIGESQRIREIYKFIARVAPTDSTVLIRGESGTGKELAARAIHGNSSRHKKPFVAVNCATLSETLLESELFGHERGAFTGAVAQKKGKLEIAEGGTIFLDEVGETAASIQAKLLRVLQEREFERVGGTRPIKADIRVVAATNRNLEEAITTGGFRKDLYYRLNVVSLVMPPLRERPEDIPLLASYFTAKYSSKCKRQVTGLSSEARRALAGYVWPGNVRELENVIERAVVLGATDRIELEDLPEAILETAPPTGRAVMSFYESVKEAKRHIILKALDQSGGSYTEAAKLLDVHPNNLHRLIRNMNLKSELNQTI